MEDKQVKQPEEQQQIQGWKDVNITADMPLYAIVHFQNILNQRLCALEDVTIDPNSGKSFTQLYKEQAEAEAKAQAEQANKKEE